ncbi:metal ABC transporter permease [Campylobacter lanienae]|uniref:Metal ABC transporter permease n=1 Tax=Campylobacter lanienae TaxID=75658 RepID=A0ABY3G6T7_9BACT|nr:iron chelate uptake ABC transporter family permease subunit [Campylobacter lanienae]MCI7364682.1 metal ABC transporter permease [Campylobacter lanienae]TWO13325.1 metal ABC transporter permease [Campylobacter lanienae]TWO28043.1 metal ABC transporter permease [Campylobacter lanienae]
MQNAILAGILVSIACGVIGSLIVINKMTFIAGGVAHGAYGGIGIAFYFGFSALFGAAGFAVAIGLLIAFISSKNRDRIDSIIGAIWAFGMSVGIIFVDLSPGYNADLMSYLFGSILAVSTEDLIFMSVLDTVFVLFALLFYTQICAFCFDSEFAKLRGINVGFLYYLMSLLIALCVVSTISVVGLILVIALLSIPPYIAEKFSPNLAIMMVLSAILSAIFILCGLILSYYFDLTSGAAIIAVATIAFFIAEFCKRG